MGDEATIAYEHESESKYTSKQEENSEIASYLPKYQVTRVIDYATYEATHPMAGINYQEFLNRKKVL